MTYAIELLFNEEMEKKLFYYIERLAKEKISTTFFDYNARPHVALAGFRDIDEKDCIEKLKVFANNHKTIPAYIGSLGMFTDTKTVFASPIMTYPLYQLHREFHESFCGFDSGGYEWYYPSRWVPHSTIAMMGGESNEAFYKACDMVLHEFEKVNGFFESIALVRITPFAEEIYVAKLNG